MESSLDCMKMWPWVRDLPTSVWSGHDWAFDENGLGGLSSSGGSHAMQGVEVFESVGAAAEELKHSDERITQAPVAVEFQISVGTAIVSEKLHGPRHLQGPGRRSSSRGRQGLPRRAGREPQPRHPNFTSEKPGGSRGKSGGSPSL